MTAMTLVDGSRILAEVCDGGAHGTENGGDGLQVLATVVAAVLGGSARVSTHVGAGGGGAWKNEILEAASDQER